MKRLLSILIALCLIGLSGCGDGKTNTAGDNRGTTGANMPANTDDDNAADNQKQTADDSRALEPAGTGADDANLPAGVQEKPADELPKVDSNDKGDKA